MKDIGKVNFMEKETNYKALFSVGFIFVCSGIAISIAAGQAGIGLLGIGIVFMVTVLANRDKWNEDE